MGEERDCVMEINQIHLKYMDVIKEIVRVVSGLEKRFTYGVH